jgi:YVTN family beta-propeller protein
MNRWRNPIFLLLLLLFADALSFGQQMRFKVLAFYSATTEPDHVRFAQDAVKFLTERAAREHFTFDVTTRWEDLNDERLKSYQLIIWLNESPTDADQRQAFERYMEGGGAWLGFHAAGYIDKDTNWPWYVDFLGGTAFDANSWPPLPARLVLDDRSHPVTGGLPPRFEAPANEWYIWKPDPRLNKNVQVLVTLDPSTYPIGFKDVLTSGDLPVVWTNTKYKMLYINMGHGDKIFTSSVQNQLIDNSVLWLGSGARQPPTLATGIRVSPRGIALNARTGKFYVVNTGYGIVTVLDGEAHFQSQVQVGKQPVAIAVNPDTNRVYVANGGSGSVSVIDGVSDHVIANIPIGDLPYTITANPATNKIYVSRTFSDVTAVIDGKTNVVTMLKAGAGDAVAADSIANNVYMISYEAPDVTMLDATNDHSSKIETPDHLWAIAADPVTRKIYAASAGSSNVTIIDGKSHTTKTVGVGEIPCAIAVDFASGKIFVANYGSNDVTVIDGAADRVMGTMRVAPRPQAMAVDSGNHRVYIASMHEGTTTIIDGRNDSVVTTVKTGRAPVATAVDSKTHEVVVLDLDGDLTVIDGTALTASPISIPEQQL